MNELSSVKELVFAALKNEVKCRDNDKYLTWHIGREVFGLDLNDWESFKRMPSLETIRRTRQKIQETHKDLVASEEAQVRRKDRQEQFRKHIQEV